MNVPGTASNDQVGAAGGIYGTSSGVLKCADAQTSTLSYTISEHSIAMHGGSWCDVN